MGIYPEILGNELSEFAPMIMLDQNLNMKSLLAPLEEKIKELEEEKAKQPKKPRIAVSKKEVSEYRSIQSFVYAKMTGAGGLVDTSAYLDDKDLRILQKLISAEIVKRKGSPKKKKK